MRTKTLLLTAALSAAGIASSMAQAVYSVNAVGYVNTPLVPGFNLISNPLDNKETGGNTIGKLFASLPNGSQVYKFVNGKFEIATQDLILTGGYDPAATANLTVTPGEGVFVKNPTTAPVTVTFVGEVPQGNVGFTIPTGFSIISSKVPQEGTATALGFVAQDGDQLYFWNEATQKYSVHTYSTLFGDFDIPLPTMSVGEAFFVKKNQAGVWTRTFTVSGQ